MIEFDEVLFRTSFPEFGDKIAYPLGMVLSVFNGASSIITNQDSLGELNLLVAHILKIRKDNTNGVAEHVISSSANGESVTILSPMFRSNFERFLYSTVYGKELAIILSTKAMANRMYIR